MDGNSFATRDGGHVTGVVAMGVDSQGNAVPVDIRPVTLEQFCRALAAHAAIVRGVTSGPDIERLAQNIIEFAREVAP